MGDWTHMGVQNFLHELKDEGPIMVKHVSGDENEAEIFTKNTAAPVFKRNIPKVLDLTSTWKKAILNLKLEKVLEQRY